MRITPQTTAAEIAPLVYEAAALCNRIAPKDRAEAPPLLYRKAYARFMRRLNTHGRLVARVFEFQTPHTVGGLEIRPPHCAICRQVMRWQEYDPEENVEGYSYCPTCSPRLDEPQDVFEIQTEGGTGTRGPDDSALAGHTFEIQTASPSRFPITLPFEIQTAPDEDEDEEGENEELEALIDDYERAFMDEPLYDDDDDEGPDDYDEYQEWSAENRSAEEADDLYGDNYGPHSYSWMCSGCDGTGDCHCVDYLDGERLTDKTCYDCGGTGTCRSCHGGGTNE